MDNKLTVIIPIHRLNESEKDYFAKAVASVREQNELPEKVMLVIPKDSKIKKELDSFDYGDKIKDILSVVENDGKTDFCSQVNFGVSNLDTEWFSILEIDDEFSKIWVSNFNKYSKYYDEVDAFLPIVLDANTDGKFLHFTNEPVWAKDFSDKLGFLDNDSLLNYPSFPTIGGYIQKR